jgi:gas vesicle protein
MLLLLLRVLLVPLILVIGIGIVIALLYRPKKSNDPDVPFSVSAQNTYQPFVNLANEIRDTMSKTSDGVTVGISKETDAELVTCLARIEKSLNARDQLKKSLMGRVKAENDVEKLSKQIESAPNPEESAPYRAALEARQAELADYARATQLVADIDKHLEMTLTTMSTLLAKLKVAAATVGAAERGEELRESLGELRVIDSTIEEAREVFRER